MAKWEIQDEKIKNFTAYRSDRTCENKTKGGGAAIYLKNWFNTRLMTAYQVESCEIVAVIIENINIINIVIYRPPDTCYSDFAKSNDQNWRYIIQDGYTGTNSGCYRWFQLYFHWMEWE